MAKKKQQAVDSGVLSIIAGRNQDKPKKKKTQSKVLSVRMPTDEVERFIEAASDLDVSKAELQAYLVRKFLKDWDEGKRPEKQTKTIEVLSI